MKCGESGVTFERETGAVEKWGLVKRAERGTLFIDELQSIDLDLQGKLITFIENKSYRRVGEAYHWRDRWDWTDVEIRAHLAQPEITLHVARREGTLAGWYELRRVPEDRSVEIAYFGLAPVAIGRGLGKHLLSCAVRDAWALGPSRVWLHTCTLDHPAALTTWIGTPTATASTAATCSDGSSTRSTFVRTISGTAPLSQIVTR